MARHALAEEIQTYIFLDTETTGLPSPGNNPRITEISLVAYSRDELLTFTRHPRVSNKLLLCLDPCKRIPSKSSDITGLFNDALEGMPTFKKQAFLITSFIENLPSPVCIVAHNGYGFDFPLLKAEFKRIKMPEALDKILCADSVCAFRNLYGLPSSPVKNNNGSLTHGTHSNSCVSNGHHIGQDIPSEMIKRHDEEKSFLANLKDIDSMSTQPYDINSLRKGPVVDSNELEVVTPQKTCNMLGEVPKPLKRPSGSGSVSPYSLGVGSYVKKRLFDSAADINTSSQISIEKNETLYPLKTGAFSEKKSMASSPSSYPQKKESPSSFSLPKLYYHYFGETPKASHTAEDDCLTLMSIVRLKHKDFFHWCNQNAIIFKNIQSMY